MKQVSILLIVVFSLSCSKAQKLKTADVPTAVQSSFKDHYPLAESVKWEKEDGNFEAEFDLNKVESSALFDERGTFLQEETEIEKSMLPSGVTNYCAQQFSGYKLTEASKIRDASGTVSFEAEMSKGKERFDAMFDASGNFVEKKVQPSDDEESED
ncbi:MAG: PepSY-like domain-containing protein [Flavobacteriales bacterium]|nr:PepSY-like domain-containing protein [Flavobacteriales bacterium]MCB9449081.1 PepSY-like domain-containing protein [Flavobacteriales bacterium]